MTVADARQVARQWVLGHAPEVPGLWAVMFGGSINWLPEDAEVDPYSDIDLWFLIKGEIDPRLRQRKIRHEGLLLEPAYLPAEGFSTKEAVLGDWVCGCHLTVPSAIHDPSGALTRLQRIAAKQYSEPAWVRRRCERMASEMRTGLFPQMRGEVDNGDRCFAFGLAVAAMVQIPMVASVKPPTLRRGGMAFTDLMLSLRQKAISERRLELLGSARLGRNDVEGLFAAATMAYDRAVEVWRTPLPFGEWDLCPDARPHMIDGARDLIDRGYHREAVFWIFYTHWLAHTALVNDAPEECARIFHEPYQRLLEAMGIGSPEGLRKKAALAEELLGLVMTLAEQIIGGTA